MKILVACEFSGVVRDAFLRRGHDAWSCDIEPTESNPDRHIQCDVLEILGDGWDMMIAHPPCTYLCNSGVQWLHTKPGRRGRMADGAEFFKRLLDAPIHRIAIENPIMHKYAKEIIGRGQDQVIQPWMFGDLEKKAVCLWLRGLPRLEYSIKKEPAGTVARVANMGPSPNRGKERSRFFRGIAEAMAEQWLKY